MQLHLQLHLHYITLHYITLYILHYTTLITPHHNYNCNCNYTYTHYLHYTTATNPLLYTTTRTTTTTALHHTTSSSCGWGDHCNHCSHFKKHNSNHLSVHQWIRSAIRDSQQPTSPIGFLLLKLPPPPCAVLLKVQGYSKPTNITRGHHSVEMCLFSTSIVAAICGP